MKPTTTNEWVGAELVRWLRAMLWFSAASLALYAWTRNANPQVALVEIAVVYVCARSATEMLLVFQEWLKPKKR